MTERTPTPDREEEEARAIVAELKATIAVRWPTADEVTEIISKLSDPTQFDMSDAHLDRLEAERKALEATLGMKINHYHRSDSSNGPMFRVCNEADAYKAAYMFRRNTVWIDKTTGDYFTDWQYRVMVCGTYPPTEPIR